MNAESKARKPSIEGYVIALDAEHLIAMYERNGESYVAEFRGGRGEFAYAHTWFRFHADVLRYSRSRRTARPSCMPLTSRMLEKIERLHVESEASQARILALPWSVVAAARRHWTSVMSSLRHRAAKIGQTFG